MKLINNKVWEYHQEPGIDGIYKAIRDAAAICYQTDVDKMKLSPKEFVENVLLKNGHTRPLEFGTVYLKIPVVSGNLATIGHYSFDSYSKRKSVSGFMVYMYITTNMRVIMQGEYDTDKEAFEHEYDKNYLDDLKYLCEPIEHHANRRTFTMWMSRGCTDDCRTHITLSSICESTRFCNYSKDKFGNELTFIKPYWITNESCENFYSRNHTTNCDQDEINFLNYMSLQEKNYLQASKENLQPQQLKRLFPLGVKAELRLCGFDDAWENFFWRRCDKHADPECQIVANMIKEIYYGNNVSL